MDVYMLRQSELKTMAENTNSDKFNLAVNEVTVAHLFDATKSKNLLQFTYYVTQADNGNFGPGTLIQPISTSTPVDSVAPSFFPVATAGSETAAVVKSLSWADQNLLTGYDSILMNPDELPADYRYFVTGILNSSQTQANDPFSSTTYPDVVSACCWAGNFVSGVNPFAD